MNPVTTLILVAAEHELRLVSASGGALTELVHRTAAGYPDGAVAFSDGPERSHGGGVSFGHEPRHSAQEIERDRFAAHAVEELRREWASGSYDRILLCAGPKLLGTLRDLVREPLRSHVILELHKDLAKLPLSALAEHLDAVL